MYRCLCLNLSARVTINITVTVAVDQCSPQYRRHSAYNYCFIIRIYLLQTLIGNRYGNAMFPPEIDADEFELLLSYTDQECAPILEHWYKLDDNAVPPVYVLRVRTILEHWYKQLLDGNTVPLVYIMLRKLVLVFFMYNLSFILVAEFIKLMLLYKNKVLVVYGW